MRGGIVMLVLGFTAQIAAQNAKETTPKSAAARQRMDRADTMAAIAVSFFPHLGPPRPGRKFAVLALEDDGSVRIAGKFSELAEIEAEFFWGELRLAKLEQQTCLHHMKLSIPKEEIGAYFLAFQEAACLEEHSGLGPYDKTQEFDDDAAFEAVITRFNKGRDGANRSVQSKLADLEFIKLVRADHQVHRLERRVADFKQRSKEWQEEAALRRKEQQNAEPPKDNAPVAAPAK